MSAQAPVKLDAPAVRGSQVLSSAMLDQARTAAARDDLTLLESLRRLTQWDTPALTDALGQAFGYPVMAMAQLHVLTPRFDCIAFTDCVQRAILPAQQPDGGLVLVITDPLDGSVEDWALRRCQAAGVPTPDVRLASADDLQAFLSLQERQLRAMDGFDGLSTDTQGEELAAVISLSSISDDENAVVRLVNSTIYDALKLQASDIHLECDANALYVQYRVDGVLMPITQVPGREMAEQVISRIKVMAELDIAERRVPQDGRFKVRVGERDIDFRVSVMPNIFGEDAVLRLLDRQALTEQAKGLRLDSLGLDAKTMAAIRKLATKPHGMLLVTGPTGSGKTTTLYAAITEIHTGQDKIVTIEDPVEYRLPRVLQIPVNEKKGLTFAKGLRSILRHDPDKIMIGEIRDGETAQIAVQAALTGHLVFTTVHANSVFDVLARFLHMGVDAYSLASALNGIVAQRLLRLNCPYCSEPAEPTADELERAGLSAAQTEGWMFKMGRGCGECRGSGYKGRRAVAEVLPLNNALRELIANKAAISVLSDRAAEAGLRDLRDAAFDMVARGETTLAEVVRVAG